MIAFILCSRCLCVSFTIVFFGNRSIANTLIIVNVDSMIDFFHALNVLLHVLPVFNVLLEIPQLPQL